MSTVLRTIAVENFKCLKVRVLNLEYENPQHEK